MRSTVHRGLPTRRAVLFGTAAAIALAGVAAVLPRSVAAQEKPAPSAAFPFEKRTADVLDSTMTYVDTGPPSGAGGRPTVVFLHGNPTSSYLWRNIIPYVAGTHRVMAPDLIGMGDSGKPAIGYAYADHKRYLDALLDQLDLGDVILVVHDWGSVLGMHWARENEGRVRGLAFMEAFVPPAMPAPSMEAMGEQNAQLFTFLRSDEGQQAILVGNFFVEEILGKIAVATPLTNEVLDNYRAPFPTPESRRPTAEWPRQVPIGGEPAETADVVATNGEWLLSTAVPKLMFSVTPGALMPAPVVEFLEGEAANLTHTPLGAGVHFVQEDHPDAIGQAIATWAAGLE